MKETKELEDQLDHLKDVIVYHEKNIKYYRELKEQHENLLGQAKKIRQEVLKEYERKSKKTK